MFFHVLRTSAWDVSHTSIKDEGSKVVRDVRGGGGGI